MKREKNELLPIKKWHTNMTYVADGCGDLPVLKLKDQIISVWKQNSIWERIKFLFHGEITFSVFSNQQPPIALSSGDIIERVDK